jgi:hypothetical protein
MINVIERVDLLRISEMQGSTTLGKHEMLMANETFSGSWRERHRPALKLRLAMQRRQRLNEYAGEHGASETSHVRAGSSLARLCLSLRCIDG